MNLLFSIDDKFVDQLKTILFSVAENNEEQEMNGYVLEKIVSKK